MKEFIEFYKEMVSACNNSTCLYCPIRKIRKVGELCMSAMFNYFIEKNETIGRKIYDEFARLNFVPNLHCDEEKYKEQLRILERYCKNNNLEIE
jgi:hypothetical protein